MRRCLLRQPGNHGTRVLLAAEINAKCGVKASEKWSGKYHLWRWGTCKSWVGGPGGAKRCFSGSGTQDPYSILGLRREASAAELKVRYRELAKQYHPDLNFDDPHCAENMSRVTAAYDFLSDPGKRRKFDQQQQQAAQQQQQAAQQAAAQQQAARGGRSATGAGASGGGTTAGAATGAGTGNAQRPGGASTAGGSAMGGFSQPGGGQTPEWMDASTMYSEFNNIFGRMASRMTRGQRPAAGSSAAAPGGASQRGEDAVTEVKISFLEAMQGVRRKVKLNLKQPCRECNASGSQAGTGWARCSLCHGTGVRRVERGIMTMGLPCAKCQGSGEILEYPCKTCRGDGVRGENVAVTIDVPAGIKDMMELRKYLYYSL